MHANSIVAAVFSRLTALRDFYESATVKPADGNLYGKAANRRAETRRPLRD
jgi:hypothetical protein